MANDFVGIDTAKVLRDTKRIQAKLDKLPPALQDFVVDEVSPYIIEIMQPYATYQHITRAQAYPDAFAVSPKGKRIPGYFSWKQFVKVVIMASEGRFPYSRTQGQRKGWKQYGKGKNSFVANEVESALFTMDDERQARLHKRMGWATVGARIREHSKGIERRALAGVKKAIKKVGLSK